MIPSALRSLAGYLSRDRILRRELPPEFGSRPIFVTPDAALGLWRRDLEKVDPILFNLARRLVRPTDVVWDVGANVGLFTFAAAAKAGDRGRVIAIEPDHFLFSLLQMSAARHVEGHAPVDLLDVAVSDKNGPIQ